MSHRKLVLLSMIAMLAFLAPLTGCDDDDDDVAAPTVQPYVMGIAFGDDMSGPKAVDEDQPEAYVNVAYPPTVPAVSINGSELGMEMEMSIYGGGFGFYGYYAPDAENYANLSIDLGAGHALSEASVEIPDTCSLTSPEFVEMDWGDDITVTWNAAEAADGYLVYYDFDVDIRDADTGEYSYFDYNGSVFIEGTSISFAGADIFPAGFTTEDVNWFDGDVDITPVSGPISAGDALNVTGSCTGMFLGFGTETWVDVDLASAEPLVEKSDDEEPSRVEKAFAALQGLADR